MNLKIAIYKTSYCASIHGPVRSGPPTMAELSASVPAQQPEQQLRLIAPYQYKIDPSPSLLALLSTLINEHPEVCITTSFAVLLG